MNRCFQLLVALCVLLLAACGGGSSESSENIVGVDPLPTVSGTSDGSTAAGSPVTAAAPGIIYMTSSTGDLVAFTPAGQRAETVYSFEEQNMIVSDVAPAQQSERLTVILSDPEGQRIDTSLHTVADGVVTAVENDFFSSLTICMDPHADAEISLGHELQLTDGSDGSAFVPVAFTADGAVDRSSIAALERVSVACPRWNSDRSIVATAAPVTPGDRSTVSTTIGAAGQSYEIRIDGCSVTQTSFSPDDAKLALAVGCYDTAWAASGLYLADVASLRAGLTLSDMIKLSDGIFGPSAWHPTGEWVVAARVDVVENQSLTSDYSQDVFEFELINVESGESVVQQLPNGASAGSFAWLSAPVHTS